MSKLPPIPIQLQTFRKHLRARRALRWAVVGVLIAVPAIWFLMTSQDMPSARRSSAAGTAQVSGPPWLLGNPDARFTVVFYADLECPYCKAYSPQIRQWVSEHEDVNLRWHHMPLTVHEPAAGQEARLVECAGLAGGHEAFWSAVQWVYANTRGDGQGLANLEAFPGVSAEIKSCISSEQTASIVQSQAGEAAKSGITATPSLRLVDHSSGKSVLLPGPVPGDALLSAIDMLAAGDAAEPPADVPSSPSDATVTGSPQ